MKHSPNYDKHIRRNVCEKCGLVYLKNKASEKAIKKECPGSEENLS